jgi:hypothetical protein
LPLITGSTAKSIPQVVLKITLSSEAVLNVTHSVKPFVPDLTVFQDGFAILRVLGALHCD